MSAVEKLDLSGLDYFTEAEAAYYCRVSVKTFRRHRAEYGIVPANRFGRNMYARADLSRAMQPVNMWQALPSNGGTAAPTSHGLRLAHAGVGPLANLTPRPLRKSAPRKKPS